ncbi:MAG: hypothetical protein RI894_2014 [Bacteroidota bacterium]|jgi:hypothetical protein
MRLSFLAEVTSMVNRPLMRLKNSKACSILLYNEQLNTNA